MLGMLVYCVFTSIKSIKITAKAALEYGMIKKNIIAGVLAAVTCIGASFLTACTSDAMNDGTVTTAPTTTTTTSTKVTETATESGSTIIDELESDIMGDVSDATHGTTETTTEAVKEGAHRRVPGGK
jgi:hypothetical protein